METGHSLRGRVATKQQVKEMKLLNGVGEWKLESWEVRLYCFPQSREE